MINMKIKCTDEVESLPMTLEITMQLSEWRNLQKQLQQTYPSWKLSSAIGDLILMVTKTFEKEVKIV